MDVAQLTPQLTQGQLLPGVALLIAHDAIESAFILRELTQQASIDLSRTVDHLGLVGESLAALRSHPMLVDELRRVASTRTLPDGERLTRLRAALSELVQKVPAEGSVPADAEYLGF